MKTFPIIVALMTLIFSRAAAQVTLEVVLPQNEFLPGESIPLAVKITNRSGQQMHLGTDADWLTFSVESTEGLNVIKNFEVPVAKGISVWNHLRWPPNMWISRRPSY